MKQPLHARTIRRLTSSDTDLLVELAPRTFREAYASQVRPEELDRHIRSDFTREHVAAQLSDPRTAGFVALEGDVPIGYALLHVGSPAACVEGPRPIELARIYLERRAVGKGHGAALLRACLEEADRLERETMWLGVWDANTVARAFYERWGFRCVGTHPYEFAGTIYDDLVMARAVAGPRP
jgi:ribosomal protein S18 acetylase RimI-like enzyme